MPWQHIWIAKKTFSCNGELKKGRNWADAAPPNFYGRNEEEGRKWADAAPPHFYGRNEEEGSWIQIREKPIAAAIQWSYCKHLIFHYKKFKCTCVHII